MSISSDLLFCFFLHCFLSSIFFVFLLCLSIFSFFLYYLFFLFLFCCFLFSSAFLLFTGFFQLYVSLCRFSSIFSCYSILFSACFSYYTVFLFFFLYLFFPLFCFLFLSSSFCAPFYTISFSSPFPLFPFTAPLPLPFLVLCLFLVVLHPVLAGGSKLASAFSAVYRSLNKKWNNYWNRTTLCQCRHKNYFYRTQCILRLFLCFLSFISPCFILIFSLVVFLLSLYSPTDFPIFPLFTTFISFLSSPILSICPFILLCHILFRHWFFSGFFYFFLIHNLFLFSYSSKPVLLLFVCLQSWSTNIYSFSNRALDFLSYRAVHTWNNLPANNTDFSN